MNNIFIKLEDKKEDAEGVAFVKPYNHAKISLELRHRVAEEENIELKKEVEHYKRMIKMSEERITNLSDQLIKTIATLKTINDFYKGEGENQ